MSHYESLDTDATFFELMCVSAVELRSPDQQNPEYWWKALYI